MRFGKKLQSSIYEPWKAHYIDYPKLKKLLREDQSSQATDNERALEWTEDDEAAFVEELINNQLEKVNAFQVEKHKDLRDRTSKCESNIETLIVPANGDKNENAKTITEKSGKDAAEARQAALQDALKDLDSITKETNELEKFSRVNFTGFLKAAKKHDRKRGQKYRVRPLLQARLGTMPFNSEDYSPLLYRLSAMYSFVRQNLDGGSDARANSSSDAQSMGLGGDKYTSHRFWVHQDNLLEVKTYILRRLPVLVYTPQTSKIVEGSQKDPTITSIYFDNPQFSLYTRKLDKEGDASSLRLRWYGQLSQKPEILLEKKTVRDGHHSEETRFPIKEKYIQPFIEGEYKMEKSVQKLKTREGQESEHAKILQENAEEIQKLIRENNLRPVLRANYTRTAFQIPGDDRVRISLDTDLALIREDALDQDRPCRDPEDWHRVDIDGAQMEYPFSGIRKGEISRFQFALLEIKIKDGQRKKKTEWISDLMHSHLLKEAPRFSKFVHGVAQLFDDYVNSFPFWLSEVEKDIRRDPEMAFEEEQEKKAKQAEDEVAVGSLLGSKSSPAFRHAIGSPVGRAQRLAKSPSSNSTGARKSSMTPSHRNGNHMLEETPETDEDDRRNSSTQGPQSSGLVSSLPLFSTSKYARTHRSAVKLPPGVRHPGTFIKDTGPVRVEAKVWLANQRTFIKWQHISVLLASLSLGLYNAAGKTNNVARSLAVVYTLIAVFAGGWGWLMYIIRSKLIRERSGKDFDNPVGPIVVCVGLIIALCLNFAFKYRAATAAHEDESGVNFLAKSLQSPNKSEFIGLIKQNG